MTVGFIIKGDLLVGTCGGTYVRVRLLRIHSWTGGLVAHPLGRG